MNGEGIGGPCELGDGPDPGEGDVASVEGAVAGPEEALGEFAAPGTGPAPPPPPGGITPPSGQLEGAQPSASIVIS